MLRSNSIQRLSRRDGICRLAGGIEAVDIECRIVLPRIFQPFYRVDKSPISRDGRHAVRPFHRQLAIEQMGGTIEIDSRQGEGSDLTVELLPTA